MRSAAKSGETKRSGSETKGFVQPAIRRSSAAATKPAISPYRAFSMVWPCSCFASAKTPSAALAMARTRGRTAGGNGMAGSRTTKGHSNGIPIFRKRLFAPATTALPCRPRANRGLSDPQRRCSTHAYPVRTDTHDILERPVAARHRLIGHTWPGADWRL